MDKIIIEGTAVHAQTPEGQSAMTPISDLVGRIAPRRMDTAGQILPDGVKYIESRGGALIIAHQTTPRQHSFKWIAPDSPAPWGDKTTYRNVCVALPYVVMLAVFVPRKDGALYLSSVNECFFRNAPLETVEDELYYPALLNCSKYTPPDGRPLSWICTEKLDRGQIDREPNWHRRMRLSLTALLRCLFEAGFNYSSEHHEGASWFSETVKANIDPRLASIETWQEATAHDRLFVLDVPWLKTGYTLHQVVNRIFNNLHAVPLPLATSSDIARLVFNQPMPVPSEDDE
jgi:hypothetical protein